MKAVHRFLSRSFILVSLNIAGSPCPAQVYEKLFSFTEADANPDSVSGGDPRGALVRGRDGTFYGTTFGSGYNRGSIFKMTPEGKVRTLVQLSAATGYNPVAELVQGSDGNFYGTTSTGGPGGAAYGTVFRMTPGGVVSVLVVFGNSRPSSDGLYPYAGVVEGSNGDFYGTTQGGGTGGHGTVFKMSMNGTLTTLVQFTDNGPTNKGRQPQASLVQGSDGNFYGTTTGGGASGNGTVFKMTAAGELTTLVEFTENGTSNKGRNPVGRLVQDSDGNFYGTTHQGGGSGSGTVFKMTPEGDLTTLVEFTGNGANNKGVGPMGGLVRGSDSNFYGTTAFSGVGNRGTIFRMTPGGVLTTLAEFSQTDDPDSNNGRLPHSGLVQGSDGAFYGTTAGGGTKDLGTIFRITPTGVATKLADFSFYGASEMGKDSRGELVEGPDGSFFGITTSGGAYDRGTVFRMSSGGIITTLVEFDSSAHDPEAGLILGADGNLYGTTTQGGLYFKGTIFRMSPSGELTTIVNFSGNGTSNRGSSPGRLIQDVDGNIYGVTRQGGTGGEGTIFKTTTSGILTTLVDFSGYGPTNKGRLPTGLVDGGDGFFYGTTSGGGASNHGTIFKMTKNGELTTLVEFSGNGATEKGSGPDGYLLLGANGNFYGTTASGGQSDRGTIFMMTSSGVLTTLVEFTGNGANNRGGHPHGGLVQRSDGHFYGTTHSGGNSDYGTIFKMTDGGLLTTIFDFAFDPIDPCPLGGLVVGSNGDLYGTTNGVKGGFTIGRGGVFHLVFDGAPYFDLIDSEVTGLNSVLVQAIANARGSSTAITVEYGIDGTTFPNSAAVSPSPLIRHTTTLVGTTLTSLSPGTNYYYRFRAVSTSGTTVSPVKSFSTLAEPVAASGLATEIGPTSARLNGTVNARNYASTVVFEWGTDGNSFPNVMPAIPGTITGHTATPVSVAVAGLVKGTSYYYRIVATNAAGTTVSGTESFRTLTEPTCTIGGSFAINTTSVRVDGTVNAQASASAVAFEFGTDGINFPNSVAATPGGVTGNTITPVSAVLTNLEQGVTYHYRIRATSEGGAGTSASASFAMNVLSGFTQVFPGSVPKADGLLIVNLAPAGIVHGWRFIGEQRWRNSGEAVTGLTVADRKIEFRPVPGFIHPPAETTDPIVGDGTATILHREYFETEDVGSGGLSVSLKPDAITTGPDRAQWRIQGENDTMWRDSGATLLGLPPGGYSIECKPFTGRTTPPTATVKINDGQTAAPTITYFLAGTASGTLPAVLAYEAVSTDETKPYAYVGQIRSQAGLGTGFAVKERVVATAAHVVWDEGTLAAAQDLQWLHQRHQGSYEPEALAPRGFYTLTGYDAQRRVENTPGSFSPQSRNRDVAALYFHGDDAARLGYAARLGFSGFLASDLDNNEFLLSNANKMLVGYPIDGVAAGSQGRMHATAPSNVAFTPVAFTPADPMEHKRVFLTTEIRSNGGASGGPICVQFEGGTYFPAAIYLGGTTQTLVRAIDSGVVGLFDLAALSGIDGQGHVGGGITHTDVTQIGGPSAPSKVTVVLQPAAAAAAGGWRLKPENGFHSSGDQRGGLNAGRYVLQLKNVPGYEAPASQNLVVPGGEHITHTFTYAPLPPEIDVSGNGTNINNGDTSPSSLDHTDFGIVGIASGTRTRTYTIQNTGDGPLSVGTVTVGGSHPGDFTVSLQPGGSVPPGESTSFQVVFDPSADGTRYATVSFANGDSDENPYTFTIRGNAGDDQDNNGFSDAEEADLGLLLLSPLILGNSANLDLSFLELGPGGSLVLLGLPTGLVFDPQSGRISGSISGTPGTYPIELQKLIGDEVVSSLALEMELAEPASLKLGTLRAFAATKVRKRSRPQSLSIGNIGGSPLTELAALATGKAARDFVLTQPLTKTLDAGGTTTFTVTFKPRAKGSRRASVTIFSNTAPKTVPVSGRGK